MERNYNINPEDIFQHFEKNVWLLEKIFGSQGVVMYMNDYEQIRNKLKNVYNLHDVDSVFPPRLDEPKLWRILDILFRVPQLQDSSQERSKFLCIF
jgi:hypothetical protein